LLGSFSIVIILIEKRGLWGLVRRVLSDDLIPIAHKPSDKFKAAADAKRGS
jgi:branched-chain amino acid transport system permease protein